MLENQATTLDGLLCTKNHSTYPLTYEWMDGWQSTIIAKPSWPTIYPWECQSSIYATQRPTSQPTIQSVSESVMHSNSCLHCVQSTRQNNVNSETIDFYSLHVLMSIGMLCHTQVLFLWPGLFGAERSRAEQTGRVVCWSLWQLLLLLFASMGEMIAVCSIVPNPELP